MTLDRVDRVLVLGTGLIGTSLGLALRGQVQVLLDDADPANLRTAVERGAGQPWDGRTAAELAVVCVPPAATAAGLAAVLRSGLVSTASHVASVQAGVQRQVETLLGADARRVCGGHPLAGRETRGPGAASARLFLGRPWVVCPATSTSDEAAARVVWLARAVGAEPVEMPAAVHDAAVALVSHLPQVAASAVAAQLTGTGETVPADLAAALRIAGPGLQDTTRIAASDDVLWTDILRGNAAQVAPLVRRLTADLAALADALERTAAGDGTSVTAVQELLRRGRQGRAALPAKPTADGLDLVPVVVSVPDRPGQLAGVLQTAAEAGINVEDVRVEHLPGRPRGHIELTVLAASAAAARQALAAGGWEVVAG